MASSNSYPSPDASQMTAGAGPFYGEPPPSVSSSIQLAADMTRNAIPLDPDAPHDQGSELHQQLQQEHRHFSAHDEQQLAMQLQEHSQPSHYGEQQQSPQQSAAEAHAERQRRSKTTRACDECRRKKIRCDASNESGEHPCSNCNRTGAMCQFSRLPMKRGPSKGYIKELADRLLFLEEQTRPPRSTTSLHHNIPDDSIDQNLTDLQNYNPETIQPNSRKRTHSVSEGTQDSVNQFSTPSNGFPNWLGEQEIAPDMGEDVAAAFQAYHDNIHPTLPFLPVSKKSLSMRLGRCPPKLRDAFLIALDSASRPHHADIPLNIQQSTQLLHEIGDPTGFPRPIRLIHLGTLILLVISTDIRGPGDAVQIAHITSETLSKAIELALGLKLHHLQGRDLSSTTDIDSDDRLARRMWWTLFILDRFLAAGNDRTPLISDSNAHLQPNDEALLGPITFSLAQLSFVIGHAIETAQFYAASPINSSLDRASSIQDSRLLSAHSGELDRIRESRPFSTTSDAVNVQLTHQLTRLLIQRSSPFQPPATRLEPAIQIASLLKETTTNPPASTTNPSQPPEPPQRSPLHHHFLTAATTTLIEICDSCTNKESSTINLGPTTKEILEYAQSALEDISQVTFLARSTLQAASRDSPPSAAYLDTTWDARIGAIVSQKLRVLRQPNSDIGSGGNSGGGMAAVARMVAGNGDANGEEDVEMQRLLRAENLMSNSNLQHLADAAMKETVQGNGGAGGGEGMAKDVEEAIAKARAAALEEEGRDGDR
ncbi:MAG: Glucose-responsive transcription factor [Bogoriella megaspora]|nr:MAG: Glucose-responsive transcription factor [Bogoriella megaspora]